MNEEFEIRRIKEATELLRTKGVEEAIIEYFNSFLSDSVPSKEDIENASQKAKSTLTNYLISQETIHHINPDLIASDETLETFKLKFNSISGPLEMPLPQIVEELPQIKLSFVALIGAIAGMMLLTPLTRLLLGIRDIGIFIGPPVGAFCFVWGTIYVAKSKRLRNILLGSLGVATAYEVWTLISGQNLFSFVWRKLSSNKSNAVKRILLYVVTIWLLMFSKREETYNRQDYEDVVKVIMKQWWDAALLILIILCNSLNAEKSELADMRNILTKLGAKLWGLKYASKENLPIIAQDILQEACVLGFDGMDSKPKFSNDVSGQLTTLIWRNELKEKYETFGNIDDGNQVFIEQEPIIFKGKVFKKGLVRKYRKE